MKDRFHNAVEKDNSAHQCRGLQNQTAKSDIRLSSNNNLHLFSIDKKYFQGLISSPSVAVSVTS